MREIKCTSFHCPCKNWVGICAVSTAGVIADLPHDMDYPYPIRILVGFLSDTAVLHFDTDFNKIYGPIIFNHIMYASQNYSTMEQSFTVSD